MLDNEKWISIAEIVAERDFYIREHQILFKAIQSLCEENNPCDVITLSEWLQKHDQFDAIGGGTYLSLLIGNTPTAANIESYAEIVRDRSVLRKMAQAGTQIAENAYNPQGRKTTDLLNDAEQVIFDIAEKGEQSGFVGINTILEDALARMEMLAEQNKVITGLSTGFDDLDKITSGLQRSDLIIIAARPSMGKTSFAMNLAEHAALNAKLPVGIFSMEMSSEQLGMRLISSLGKIDLRKVRTGNLEETGWGQTVEAVSQLTDSYLFIDETPALTPTELRSRARRLARDKGKLGLIVVDYLQLMRIPNTRENRTNEVSEIARALKALAKELDVPVIALSQLNRSLEQRADKRPIMSDLRDSGEIEQLADIVTFIYRDEVYNNESTEKGDAEIIIAKQRNGPIGKVSLSFLGQFTRFESKTKEGYNGN